MDASQDFPLRDLSHKSTKQATSPSGTGTRRDNLHVNSKPRQLRKESHVVLQHEEFDDQSPSPASPLLPTPKYAIPTWDLLWAHWRWEMYACLLAMTTIVATVVTLYPNDRDPIPQWPFKISINALLSVYALTFKSAILFVISSCLGQLQWLWFSFHRPLYDLARYDDAGRGPTGSVRLLWARQFQQPLAALGALVTVASVAIGPFMQQLLKSTDCNTILEHEQAMLPRTSVFDGSGMQSIGRGIETAINQGIFMFSSAETNFGQCTTGNCTFGAPYRTLGFCSHCEDSSDKIVFESSCSVGNVTSEDTPEAPHNCPPDSAKHVVTRLPGVSKPLSMISHWAYNSTREHWDVPPKINLCNTSYEWGDKGQQSLRVHILAGKTIFSENGWDQITGAKRTGCDDPGVAKGWHCRGYGAATCLIQPCVRTYNASIIAGALTEQLLEVSYPRLWGRGYASLELAGEDDPRFAEDDLGLIDMNCTSKEQNDSLGQQGYKLDPGEVWLPYNTTSSSNEVHYKGGPFVQSLLDRECLYMFSINDIMFGLGSIPDNLMGWVTANVNTEGTGLNASFKTRRYDGPVALRHLYDYGQLDFDKIQSTFANISESSTQYVRMYGARAHSAPALGQVLHYATCLEVQWAWIALPASLGALTLLLFLAVVVTTEGHQVPIWKSSILPWIFRGP